MAKEISITRPHKLGLAVALERAMKGVEDVAKQYGFTSRWSGNEVAIMHGFSGITGKLIVSEKKLEVYADLNIFQLAFKGTLESAINKVLDQALA